MSFWAIYVVWYLISRPIGFLFSGILLGYINYSPDKTTGDLGLTLAMPLLGEVIAAVIFLILVPVLPFMVGIHIGGRFR